MKKSKKTEFDVFRDKAKKDCLTKYQKIGFPDDYRKNHESNIFKDIKSKLTNLSKRNKVIVDIGAGCSDLPKMIIEHCRKKNNELILIDSKEMLNLLPDDSFIQKIDAQFPKCYDLIYKYNQKVDVIIVYSVLQYVMIDSPFYEFIDKALSLLNNGGQILFGDVPNISKRKRFFSSSNGKLFHKKFMNTDDEPLIEYNKIEFDLIDDSIVLSIISRARAQGFEAYILPQRNNLPMSNRREDILIIRQ